MEKFTLTPETRAGILEKMETLLDEYGYTTTTAALDDILDEWYNQKRDLLTLLARHPLFNPSTLAIDTAADYPREWNAETARRFKRFVLDLITDGEVTLPAAVIEQRDAEHCAILPDKMYQIICSIPHHKDKTLTEMQAAAFRDAFPDIRGINEGLKSSRAFAKIFAFLGIDKHPDFNRRFAVFADNLNPAIFKRRTVISVNPLDYLTMSFGNSWASCHTIDKQNLRDRGGDHFNGCYSAGTMSYMLDPSSMVVYTAEDFGYSPLLDKYTRQMFFYDSGRLVQSRLYPQGSEEEAYTPYRNLMQSVFAECLGLPNLWTLKRGIDEVAPLIHKEGAAYADWECYSSVNISYLRGYTPDDDFGDFDLIAVSADPICIECGCRHDCEDSINCCTPCGVRRVECPHCGEMFVETEGIWHNEVLYCDHCVVWCDDCGESHLHDEGIEWLNGAGWVCDDCRDHYEMCDACKKYTRQGLTLDEESGKHLCRRCYREAVVTREMRFKVGDKVVLRDDLVIGEYDAERGEKMYCTREMIDKSGEAVTIEEVCAFNGCYHIEGHSLYWSIGMFDLDATAALREEVTE